jgi:hypothetical protein
MYETRFEVAGTGRFPIDMLRYDAAFPAFETAAGEMSGADRADGPLRVTLTHYHPTKTWMPAAGRWASFGWRVVAVHPSMKVR